MFNYKEGEVKIIDIETNGFLSDLLDYSEFPYKLLPETRKWVVSIRDLVTNEVVSAIKEDITEDWIKENLKGLKVLVAHNGIKFDFPFLKLLGLLDYRVGYPGQRDTVFGEECAIIDTLILSRLLNPDRRGGHSLGAWGKVTGENKQEFRALCIEKGYIDKNSPEGEEFKQFVPEMVEYCEVDTLVNRNVFIALVEEMFKEGNWKSALKMETKLADLSFRKEQFGFDFDKELAIWCIKDLTEKMNKLEKSVNPNLPPKPLNKTEENFYTPPKTQIKKDGELSAHMVNFIKRVEGDVFKEGDDFYLVYKGENFKLPIEEPLETSLEATIDDMDHVKQVLIDEHGWEPSEWRIRDLTVDSKKKKLPYDKRIAAYKRWLKDTLGGKYKKQRLEIAFKDFKAFDVRDLSYIISEKLKEDWPVRVPTSPPIKVGVAKDLCPNLVKLGDKVSFARDFADYMTYKDRRSNIAGGKIEGLDLSKEKPSSGYLKEVRDVDGRIPTPAIEIGTNTHRMTHISVANIPRTSSLYGEYMRALFRAGEGYVLLGQDAKGLEARIQAHFLLESGHKNAEKEANLMIGEKPNDIHTVTAESIGVTRDDAKSIRYACLPEDNTEVLTVDGWKYFKDLNEGDKIVSYNTEKDLLEEDVVLKRHSFKNKPVIKLYNNFESIESTPEHRWYGNKRVVVEGKRVYKNMFLRTDQIKTEFRIKRTSVYNNENSVITYEEARILGWILADGWVKWTGHLRNKEMGVQCRITQSEKKYVKTLEKDLKNAGVEYKKYEDKRNRVKNPCYQYSVSPKYIRALFKKMGCYAVNKHDVFWQGIVLKMNQETRKGFLETFHLADGSLEKGVKTIKQNRGNIQDAVVLAAYLNGENVFIVPGDGKCDLIRFRRNKFTGAQVFKKETLPPRPTFCITTNNGTFVMRQNKNFISITGNCMYGASEKKITNMMGEGEQRGKEIYEDFWKTSPALTAFTENLVKEWETKGNKSFIPAIDGRLIRTRKSSHNLTNYIFQSTGVIFMKYLEVDWFRRLEELGYCIDPFEGRPDINNCISYHDENDVAVRLDLIGYETFETKEKAEEYVKREKEEGRFPSEVSKGKEFYYVAKHSDISQALHEAYKFANEFLNIKVEMDFDYQVGNSWGDVH